MFCKVAPGRGQLNHRRDGATQAQPPANPTTRPSSALPPVPWTLGKSAKGAVGPVARLLGPLATSECHPPKPDPQGWAHQHADPSPDAIGSCPRAADPVCRPDQARAQVRTPWPSPPFRPRESGPRDHRTCWGI